MNLVILSGNLGGTPELKFTKEAKPFLPLRLATNDVWYDGERKQERTHWHDVVVWGARAEGLARVLEKGMRVNIQGSLRPYSYEKEDEKRYGVEITVRDLEILGHSAKRDDAPAANDTPPRGARNKGSR